MVRRITTATTTAAATTTTTTPIKKKRGRPSLIDLQLRVQLQKQNPNYSQSSGRSTRRIPNLPAHFLDGSDSDSLHSDPDPDPDDDDDERGNKKKKKVEVVVNKNAVDSQEEQKKCGKSWKATDNNNIERTGTKRKQGGLEHGPTTSRLPDNKLLLLLLDRLQKRDTRGVFSEPVDPDELPDYHEIIENPMDFETVRKKLTGGAYTTLEQLEDDIYLISSNAMQYNSPSTMFFRQARAIQELAKKEFEILRQDGSLSESPIKPRRGRPPGSKNSKKVVESSVPKPSVAIRESSSEAIPAPREVDPTKSGSYNLRKVPSLYRSPLSFDYCFEFSASSSKSMSAKYGKKTFGSDESRRDTYFLSCKPDSSQDPYSLATFEGFEKELNAQVGLSHDHSYSRSLARFAADLGPAIWKIASKKIKNVLPQGVEFGPGWVGEPNMSSTQSNYVSQESRANFSAKPLASCSEKQVEPQEFNSNVDWSSQKGVNNNGVVGPIPSGPSMQIHHLNSVDPRMNGINGGVGSNTQFKEGIARPTSSPSPSPSSSLFHNPYAIDSSSSFDASRNFHGMMSSGSDFVTQGQGVPFWQNLSMQEQWDHPYHVELNRGFQGSSLKNSNLPMGSPPQLDLVLQL